MPLKMRASLIIFFLTLSTPLKAQLILDSLVLTKEQNAKWISKFESVPKSKQLEMVRTRILLDTNIYVNEYYPDGLKVDNDKQRGKRTLAHGRPVLVFNQQYTPPIGNKTKSSSILKFSQLLTDDRIKSISIMKGVQATVLYGSSAEYGVIVMTTKDKTSFKTITRLRFEFNED